MSSYEDIEKLLKACDAFVAGGQGLDMVAAAEQQLEVTFPASFREYLMRWGNVSFAGREYFGLTRNLDFQNASIPNGVWFTLRKRAQVGLPRTYVVFRCDNDDLYYCIDTGLPLAGNECGIAIWDNVERSTTEALNVTFIEFLREELMEVM